MTPTVTTAHTTRSLAGALLVAGYAFVNIPVTDVLAADAAQNKTPLTIALTAQKVVKQSDGSEKFITADRALPGETIQYDTLCHNRSGKPLNNVAPMLPIPTGMVYVADSASPAPTEASLDGKTFSAIPLKRKVTTPTGEVIEQEVPATEYRALRWKLGEMAPGTKTVLVARTKITMTN